MKIKLKALRINKGLGQEELAKMVGKSIGTISNWENGVTEPKYTEVIKLCKILGVSLEEIMLGEKDD